MPNYYGYAEEKAPAKPRKSKHSGAVHTMPGGEVMRGDVHISPSHKGKKAFHARS